LIPIQPSPIAETSSGLLLPSLRFFIFSRFNGSTSVILIPQSREKNQRQRCFASLNMTDNLRDVFQMYRVDHADLREAISMEKRYFTSDFNSLSYASLTFWIGMTSTSAVILCLPQKSSISCVSGMPPIIEPDKLRRREMRLNPVTPNGS